MTELTQPLAAAPSEAVQDARRSPPRRGARRSPSSSMSHFDWWQALRKGTLTPAAAAEYQAARSGFEERHGEIVSAYWCSHVESAVALTQKKRRLPWASPISTFHRESDWATQEAPEIAAELHRCDELAVRAKHGAHGRSAGDLHAARDGLRRAPAQPRRCRASRTTRRRTPTALARERKALAEAEEYYSEAANGQAQIVYFVGMAAVAARDRDRRCDLAGRSTGPRPSPRSSPARSAQSSASSSASTGQVHARVRHGAAVRDLPRRAAAADRRRLRARALVRVHRRSAPSAGRGRRIDGTDSLALLVVASSPASASAGRRTRSRPRAAGRREARTVTDGDGSGLSRGDLLRLDYDHTLDQLGR